MNVLAIETSCDDTSVAIVNSDRRVLSCLVADQNQVHAPFGGIVPEIASRNHSQHLLPIVEEALVRARLSWGDIQGVAVTSRPGLVGSLIVGLVAAKTLSFAKQIPFLGVHHIEGHIVAPFLKDESYSGPDFYKENFVALVVSGGHTSLYHVRGVGNYELLGKTIDDAAGEAFDKFAKVMGLPYPGGVHIDQAAKNGNPQRFDFPRPLLKQDGFDFSFSGLKASGQRTWESLNLGDDPEETQPVVFDLCASYQAAIVDVLVQRMQKAMETTGSQNLLVSGGVSANSALRQAAEALAHAKGYQLGLPPLRYCTDNAAMIGLAGLWRLENGERSEYDLPPLARAEI